MWRPADSTGRNCSHIFLDIAQFLWLFSITNHHCRTAPRCHQCAPRSLDHLPLVKTAAASTSTVQGVVSWLTCRQMYAKVCLTGMVRGLPRCAPKSVQLLTGHLEHCLMRKTLPAVTAARALLEGSAVWGRWRLELPVNLAILNAMAPWRMWVVHLLTWKSYW